MKKIKRCCLLVTDALSFNVLCRGQLEYLKEKGFELVLVAGGGRDELDEVERRGVGRVVNVGFVRKPSLLKDLFALFRLFWFFLFNRFDLVVYSTPKALLLASVAAFCSGQSRRIAIVRGRAYENFSGLRRSVFAFLDKVALSLSSEAVFISHSLRDSYLEENLVSSRKSVVLGAGSSNGVDEEKFFPLSDERRRSIQRALGLTGDGGAFLVFIAGRICADKGIQEIASVIERLAEEPVKFVFVGRVEDSVGGAVLSSLKRSYPLKVVHFEHTSRIAEYFQCADLHLFLSHREGFGNVAIEAAACGVGTVAFNVVGVKDSVADGISGKLFEFGDIIGVANYIKETMTSRGGQRVCLDAARDWVVKNYSAQSVWAGYVDFYKRGR